MYILDYKDFIKAKNFINSSDELVLFHGTDEIHSSLLIKNGFTPNSITSGNQCGQSKYLYLTTDYDDALYFSNQKDSEIVLSIRVKFGSIRFDPEDGDSDIYNNSIEYALYKYVNSIYSLPVKLVAFDFIESDCIKLANRTDKFKIIKQEKK